MESELSAHASIKMTLTSLTDRSTYKFMKEINLQSFLALFEYQRESEEGYNRWKSTTSTIAESS